MYKQRLNEYIEQDQIYQDYKKGKEPAHNDGCSDFDWFCIEHCKDIEDLLDEVEELHNKIDKIEEWLKYKAEALDRFDIPKRKETGAFWFTTRGEIDGLLEILKDSDVDE